MEETTGVDHEGEEIGLEAAPLFQQLFPAAGQQVRPAEAAGETLQQAFDVIEVAAGDQPVGRDHARQGGLQGRGQQGAVGLQQAVEGGGEVFEGLRVKEVPVAGQEVVVGDIDQDAAAVAQGGVQPSLAAPEGRAGFGETVDAAVLGDAAPHPGRKSLIQGPFDVVAQQRAEAAGRIGIAEK